MKVIKLGGSLMKKGLLQNWLKQIEIHAKGQCVILPGGGVFADFIREAQIKWAFDDQTAHQMALLSMEQYAYYCQSLIPSTVLARNCDEINRAIEQGLIPICMASSVFHDSNHLDASWNVSSDSISIQLAVELNAEALLFIKNMPENVITPINSEELLANQLVDKAFANYINSLNCPYYFLPAAAHQQLSHFFS